MFWLGIAIQHGVEPFLQLFTKPGFAPLLAFSIVVAAVGIGARVYFWHVLPGKKSIRNAALAVSSIKNQSDFTDRYNEIDSILTDTKVLRHGWEEFKETLIPPDDPTNPNSRITVFRNTVRPFIYLNINEIESTLRLKRIHFVSNLLIGIGLLLTFIGLVAALTEAGAAIGAANADFQEPIKKLLAVAAFKFWTSVSGLGCSIALRIFYEVHHNNIKRLLGQINAGLERGLHFVTPESLAIDHLREAQEQSGAMKRFSTDVAISLTKALQPVSESLMDIGQRITGGIGDAVQSAAGSEMKALAHNLNGIVESLNNSRTEMDGVASSIRAAITEAADSLRAASGAASSEMSTQMRDAMASLTEESRKQSQMFDDSMKKLSNIMDQASEAAGGTISEAAKTLASGMTGVSDGVRDAAGSMAERMQSLSSVMQSIEDRMSTHITAMDALTDRAQDTEKAIGATSRMLTEAAVPVTQATNKMATSTENLNQSITGIQQVISSSHDNLMALTKKMEETQETLKNAWQAYDLRFGAVDESLGRAVQGIVENVSSNIQNMEKFVLEVDKNLSAAVRTFGQSITELNETAEDFEKASSNLLSSVTVMTGTKAA